MGARRDGITGPLPPVPRARTWIPGALAGALLTAGLILGVHRASPRTLINAHGMVHTAIAQRFQQPGPVSLPPENPFVAGTPLPYYWVWHWLGATLASAADVPPVVAMEWITLGGTLLLWLAGAWAGCQLFGRGWTVPLLVLGGANAAGALWLAGYALQHGVPQDDGLYLYGIAHRLLREARLNDPYSMYGPLYQWFLNTSSRPAALGLLMAVVACQVAWVRTGRRLALAGAAAAALACTALSPLIGLSGNFALAGGLVLAVLVRAEASVRRLLAAAAAAGAGALAVVPSFSGLLDRSGGNSIRLQLDGPATLGIAASLVPLAVLAGLEIRRAQGLRCTLAAALVAAAAACIAASMFLLLEAGNHVTFLHAGALLLAVPAAGPFAPAAGSRGRGRAGAVLALCLPTCAVVTIAYLGRPPLPVRADGTMWRRYLASDPLARLYEWIEAETPRPAVFVIDPRVTPTMVGNAPELPAMTRRVLFVCEEPGYLCTPHADAPRRHAAAVALAEGRDPGPDGRGLLAALGRPVYLLSHHAHETILREALTRRHGAALFQADRWAVFRILP